MNTRYIAIIVPEISNSFFAEIVNGVEFVANNPGYHVVIYQTHDSTDREINIIRDIIPRVKKHEGVKPKKYIDSRGIPTVGVGFNLKRSDADQKLKSVGANPIKVKQGKQALNNNQIETLLVGDLKISKEAANRIVGNLTQHPAGVQGVLVEMAFNLGATGLYEFKNFVNAVKAKNYSNAAQEMLKSNWSKQVGDRAKTLADIITSSQG
jgi:GH24 family phage-related lysozyme (muramidase)